MTNQTTGPWTEEKIDQLRSLYGKHSTREIAKKMGLSRYAVKGKAERLGLMVEEKEWADESLAALKEMWPNHSSEEIAHRIGYSESAVRRKGNSLGLHRDGPGWPEADTAMLRELWPNHSGSHIARLLGTTRNAVVGKARRIGLLEKGQGWSGNVSRAKPRQPSIPRQSKPKKEISTERPRILPAVDLSKIPSEITPLGISFFDLKSRHCRFPIGEESITYCGHLALDGHSYCYGHYCMAYQLTNRNTRTVFAAQWV